MVIYTYILTPSPPIYSIYILHVSPTWQGKTQVARHRMQCLSAGAQRDLLGSHRFIYQNCNSSLSKKCLNVSDKYKINNFISTSASPVANIILLHISNWTYTGLKSEKWEILKKKKGHQELKHIGMQTKISQLECRAGQKSHTDAQVEIVKN